MSSSVSVSLEAEPELQNVVVKLALEPMLPRVLPLSVHNLEPYVLHREMEEELTIPVNLGGACQ